MFFTAIALMALGAAAAIGTLLDIMRNDDRDLYEEWMRRRRARKGVKM